MRSGAPQTNRGESKAVRTCFRIIIITVAVVPFYFLGRPLLWYMQGKISEWQEDWRGTDVLLSEDGGEMPDFKTEITTGEGTQETSGKDGEDTKAVNAVHDVQEGDGKGGNNSEDRDKSDQGDGESSPQRNLEGVEQGKQEDKGGEEDVKEETKPEEKEEVKEETKPEEKEEVKEESKLTLKEDGPDKNMEGKGSDEDVEKPSENEQKKVEQADDKKSEGEVEPKAAEKEKDEEKQEKGEDDSGKGTAIQREDEETKEGDGEKSAEIGEPSEEKKKDKAGVEARNIIQEGRPLSQLLKQPIWAKPPQGTTYPEKEEFALRREMVEYRAKKNVIVVTFANFAFMDFVTTWAGHLTDLGVTNILVGAMDEKILAALFWAGVPVFDMDSHMAVNDVGWGTPIFHKMGREKVTLVNAFLNLGYEILMCDTDMVFLRDPVEYMARFPDADVLTSSDNIVNSVDDESLEEFMRAAAAYNIGILHFRPTPPAISFVKEWNQLLVEDDNVWDQNGFNDIMRRKTGPAVEGGSKNLFYSFDGKLKLGILPVSIFCSGHTYFIQRMHKRLGLDVFAIHTTFQFAGTEGKRHRLREATYFYDPPEYYDPPGGLMKYIPQIPESILREGDHTVVSHFRLVHFQYKEVRAAMALASILGRTLILPEFWCRFDRIWYPHKGILDGVIMPQPFLCPADHVLEIFAMLEEHPEERFGKKIHIREYSLLDNPRMESKVKADKMDIKICKPGTDGCGKQTSPTIFKLKKSSNAEEIKEALKPYEDTKLLIFNTMKDAFGGFTDKEEELRFRRRVNMYSAAWCCINANPGHIWYDMFWDEKENWEPHPPKKGEDHRPNLELVN